MNNSAAVVGRTNRSTGALVRLLLLILAGLTAWWLDQRQVEFGEQYVDAVKAKRPDLMLENSDFEGQTAQVQFQLIRFPEGGVTEARFVSELGKDLEIVFCGLLRAGEFGDDLKISLLNVGVRYDSGDRSDWVLSHAYSVSTCSTHS